MCVSATHEMRAQFPHGPQSGGGHSQQDDGVLDTTGQPLLQFKWRISVKGEHT